MQILQYQMFTEFKPFGLNQKKPNEKMFPILGRRFDCIIKIFTHYRSKWKLNKGHHELEVHFQLPLHPVIFIWVIGSIGNEYLLLFSDLDFQCLATWKDGSDYMYGKFSGRGMEDKDRVYRCFVSNGHLFVSKLSQLPQMACFLHSHLHVVYAII